MQFMVRDHERHKDTDGWGYAVFNSQGVVAIGEPQKAASKACNACHQVVRDRGGVFTEVMPPLLGLDGNVAQPALTPKTSAVSFASVEVAILPDYVRKQIPPQVKKVRQMQGSIPQHVFHGTIYEAWPLVAAEFRSRRDARRAYRAKRDTGIFVGVARASDRQDSQAVRHAGRQEGDDGFRRAHHHLSGAAPEMRYEYKPVDPYCSPAGPPDRKTL